MRIIPVKTKQKILNAALNVLLENGFQALTQTRVAEEAGVSQGNLTYHFPTRNDLLRAVVDESKARMGHLRTFEGEVSLSWTSIEEIMTNFALSSHMPRLMLALTVAGDEDPSLADWFAESNVQTLKMFGTLLSQLGYQADDATLHFVRATVIGASMIHLQQNSEASEQAARASINMAFEHLVKHARPL